jgi:hypothetical protein
MTTFYAKGKLDLIILDNDVAIFHVTEKCLCVTFGFQPRIMHISKYNAFYNNNNVITPMYQVSLLSAHRLGWTLCVGGFKTIGENLPKSS